MSRGKHYILLQLPPLLLCLIQNIFAQFSESNPDYSATFCHLLKTEGILSDEKVSDWKGPPQAHWCSDNQYFVCAALYV